MKTEGEYQLFIDFINAYLPSNFRNINPNDDLILNINSLMSRNKQFFYMTDMLDLKFLYTSKTIKQVLGLEPEEYGPGNQFRDTHPDDISRHSISRARIVQLCNDLYIKQEEKYAVMSTSLRYRNINGHYINFLVQGYVFTSFKQVPTTYALYVNTDISWFGPIKHGYNYYIGDDLSMFRLPDEDLIRTGIMFTDREFEIVKLIRDGLNSNEIGEKLFISTHTVDTHRRNILKKTGFRTTSELIIDLKGRGFI